MKSNSGYNSTFQDYDHSDVSNLLKLLAFLLIIPLIFVLILFFEYDFNFLITIGLIFLLAGLLFFNGSHTKVSKTFKVKNEYYCYNCRNKLEINSNYCDNCGFKLK